MGKRSHNGYSAKVAEMTMQDIKPERVYTLQQAADYLQVHVNTVRRWVKTGIVPGFKVGKFWRIYGRDLLALNKPTKAPEEG